MPPHTLSKRTLETLLDLVEIKLSCMDVWDREDRRELQSLELARHELRTVGGLAVSGTGDELISTPVRRRGRPRASEVAPRQASLQLGASR